MACCLLRFQVFNLPSSVTGDDPDWLLASVLPARKLIEVRLTGAGNLLRTMQPLLRDDSFHLRAADADEQDD
jgi:hypothetical protein